jgi:hypothetical protein
MSDETQAPEAATPVTAAPVAKTLDELAVETVKAFVAEKNPKQALAALARALGGLSFAMIGEFAKAIAAAKAKTFEGSTDLAVAMAASAEKAKHDTRVQHAERALASLHKAEGGFNAAAQGLAEHEIHADRSKNVK